MNAVRKSVPAAETLDTAAPAAAPTAAAMPTVAAAEESTAADLGPDHLQQLHAQAVLEAAELRAAQTDKPKRERGSDPYNSTGRHLKLSG